jgi:senataxin
LFSNITAVLSQATTWEIDSVEKSRNFEPPKDLFYEITLEIDEDGGSESDEEKTEPEKGDLIALTDVRPKCIADLNRPKRFYLIAYVHGPKNMLTGKIPILASKPIWNDQDVHEYENETLNVNKKQKLFAVYLMNLITNVRIWCALNPPEGGNTNIIKTVLQANSPVRILSHFLLYTFSSILAILASLLRLKFLMHYVFIPNRLMKIV